MRLAAAVAGPVLALFAASAGAQVTIDEQALAQQALPGCPIFPPEVATGLYAGFSAQHMCEAGLQPLWRGLVFDISGLPDVFPVTRFTFSDGHGIFWRTVELTEQANGTGAVRVYGGGFTVRGVRRAWVEQPVTERRLSARQMARFNTVLAAAETFNHAIGSWDRQDGETIYRHCQVLEMERLENREYRYSSVNIGCNQPRRLMPLVDEVIRLAGIESVRSAWAEQ